jgi:EmrB/QacA subfamily drug resistance transporter
MTEQQQRIGAAPSTEDSGTPAPRHAVLAAAVLMVAALMDLLDGTIVNVALPTIQRGLGASPTQVEWVVSGYMLAFAATLITAGRLGDLFGRRRLFLVGVVGFGVASLLSGVAQTPNQLIVSRIAQGAAAAVVVPQVLASFRTLFTGRQRLNAFAAYGAVAGLAAALGVILGGLLTQADLWGLGWRVVFLVNVPVVVAVLVGTLLWVPESRAGDRQRLDLVGAVLLAAGLVAIVYPLLEGRRLGWPLWCVALIVGGVLLLGALLVLESRLLRAGVAPVLQPQLFRVPAFVAGLGVQGLFSVGLQGFSIALALWLQEGHGFAPLHAGVTLIPFTLGAVVTAPVAGRLAVRFGRSVLASGALLMVLGALAIDLAAHAGGGWVSTWGLAPGGFVAGAGLGLLVVPLVNVVLTAVPRSAAGGASGAFSTAQQLGGAVGVAVVGGAFFARLGSDGFDAAFQAAMPWVVGAFALSGVLCFLLPRTALTDEDATELE